MRCNSKRVAICRILKKLEMDCPQSRSFIVTIIKRALAVLDFLYGLWDKKTFFNKYSFERKKPKKYKEA